MKIFTKIAATIALFTISATSCQSVLDVEPTDRYSATAIWASEEAVDQYVIGLYTCLRDDSEIYNYNLGSFRDAYSDLFKSSSWDQYNHPYNKTMTQMSSFSEIDAGVFECWFYSYDKIKRYNEFLRDAETYADNFNVESMNNRKGEIHFMRGYIYYRLARVYGGAVIRTSVDGPTEANKPRATEQETWDQAISDLEFAAQNTPESWVGQRGRVTKAAAYAMLSRVALFAQRWDVAIDAANKCAEYGGSLSASYDDLFNNINNPELLLSVEFLPQDLTHRADVFFRPIGDSPYHNNINIFGAMCPTSEYVDRFEMADGTPFSWTTHGNDPYSNRDPRLYASILYNGAQWEDRTIETFDTGVDGRRDFQESGAAGSTVTGYYFRKYITEDESSWETKGSSHYSIVIRYAEVLLNKAEALAQQNWSSNMSEALATLNSVRARVGLPEKQASTLSEFMALIEQERIVELGGEGQRFWDLRRWDRAVDVINGKSLHGVKILKSGDSFNYSQINVDADKTRIYEERFNLFSIPLTERTSNILIGENNPGW